MLCYHGSNQFFKEFDKSKLLTGEGINLKGKGFYFSLDKNIALEYAKSVSNRYLYSSDGKKFDLSYGLNIQSIDECVACIFKILEDENCSVEEAIKSVVGLYCIGNSLPLYQKLIKQVTFRYNQIKNWKKNPAFLYSIEINNEYLYNKSSIKIYNGGEDGICLIVYDPTIIKIINIEEIKE